ncbi:hypothetical protein AAY473_039262 [Plecturocebus cupreus]
MAVIFSLIGSWKMGFSVGSRTVSCTINLASPPSLRAMHITWTESLFLRLLMSREPLPWTVTRFPLYGAGRTTPSGKAHNTLGVGMPSALQSISFRLPPAAISRTVVMGLGLPLILGGWTLTTVPDQAGVVAAVGTLGFLNKESAVLVYLILLRGSGDHPVRGGQPSHLGRGFSFGLTGYGDHVSIGHLDRQVSLVPDGGGRRHHLDSDSHLVLPDLIFGKAGVVSFLPHPHFVEVECPIVEDDVALGVHQTAIREAPGDVGIGKPGGHTVHFQVTPVEDFVVVLFLVLNLGCFHYHIHLEYHIVVTNLIPSYAQIRPCCVTQAGLELLASSDSLVLPTQSAGIPEATKTIALSSKTRTSSQGNTASASAVADTVCGELVRIWGFSPSDQNLEAGGPPPKNFEALWWKFPEDWTEDVMKETELWVDKTRGIFCRDAPLGELEFLQGELAATILFVFLLLLSTDAPVLSQRGLYGRLQASHVLQLREKKRSLIQARGCENGVKKIDSGYGKHNAIRGWG